jgi:hypothetical protein
MKFQSSKLSKLNNKHIYILYYLDSRLDIFNIYMPKHTCMNHKLALKDIILINMLSKSLTHK